VLGLRRHRLAEDDRRFVDRRRAGARKMDGVVVLRDRDHPVAGADEAVHRRVELDRSVGPGESEDRGVLIESEDFAEALAGERRLLLEVDLVAAEVEQLLVDDREPRLARGLNGDPRQQVGDQHQLRLVARRQGGDGEVPRLPDLRHDVVRLGPAVGTVGDREQRLDGLDVGLRTDRRQEDDAARARQVDDRQIVHVGRVAGAADDPRGLGVADPLADLVLHLDLVAVAEDHDGGSPLVLVGGHQLGDDREDARRPAEDDGVAALEHPRAALAQRVELGLDGRRQRTDERADDEDAAEGDRQHGEEERPAAGVAPHGAGVEGAHQRHPGDGDEARLRTALGLRRDAGRPDQGREDDDQADREQRQVGDDDHRPARQRIVEGVGESLAQIGFAHHRPPEIQIVERGS
jgi:hypothetical protein